MSSGNQREAEYEKREKEAKENQDKNDAKLEENALKSPITISITVRDDYIAIGEAKLIGDKKVDEERVTIAFTQIIPPEARDHYETILKRREIKAGTLPIKSIEDVMLGLRTYPYNKPENQIRITKFNKDATVRLLEYGSKKKNIGEILNKSVLPDFEVQGQALENPDLPIMTILKEIKDILLKDDNVYVTKHPYHSTTFLSDLFTEKYLLDFPRTIKSWAKAILEAHDYELSKSVFLKEIKPDFMGRKGGDPINNNNKTKKVRKPIE